MYVGLGCIGVWQMVAWFGVLEVTSERGVVIHAIGVGALGNAETGIAWTTADMLAVKA